jgi:hypothetical protein
MSNLAEQLLQDIQSEEVKNPDTGLYDNASFDEATLSTTKNGGFQSVTKFTVNRPDGTAFRHKEYINLPMSDSHARVKQIGLGWYQALGIVPAGAKNIPLANSQEAAEKIVQALNTLAGSVVGLSINEDDKGFLRARPMRKRS